MRCSIRLFISTLLAVTCTPAGQASAASELGLRPLHRGHHGHDVKRLQQALRRVHVARLSADGAFGQATERAVRRYERRERLQVDGRVSKGQGRGLLRRAGLHQARAAKPAASAESTAPGAASSGRFPVAGHVTWGDTFGTRSGRHEGVDLLSDCGTPLVATDAVTVTERSSGGPAGRYLILTQDDGREWIYMHLSQAAVHTGDRAGAGAVVGQVGQTGNATACHLHVELRPGPGRAGGAAPVDPEPLLRSLSSPDQN
jgi:murein DD-endopeptidase MepM/ murein hydrolase activator NlpD